MSSMPQDSSSRRPLSLSQGEVTVLAGILHTVKLRKAERVRPSSQPAAQPPPTPLSVPTAEADAFITLTSEENKLGSEGSAGS